MGESAATLPAGSPDYFGMIDIVKEDCSDGSSPLVI
jgi:hypothetical protein